MSRYEILLKGGTIIDGQRTPRFVGDVAIAGGRIAQLGGGVSESDAARVIEKIERAQSEGDDTAIGRDGRPFAA